MADAHRVAQEAARLTLAASRVAPGLLELLVNAVEHGNLGIEHADKRALLAAGAWAAEVERRLALPGFGERVAQLTARHESGAWCFELIDQGSGFDPQPWMTLDAGRRGANCGRGIALAAQLYFDRLVYQPPGNRVQAYLFDTARTA